MTGARSTSKSKGHLAPRSHASSRSTTATRSSASRSQGSQRSHSDPRLCRRTPDPGKQGVSRVAAASEHFISSSRAAFTPPARPNVPTAGIVSKEQALSKASWTNGVVPGERQKQTTSRPYMSSHRAARCLNTARSHTTQSTPHLTGLLDTYGGGSKSFKCSRRVVETCPERSEGAMAIQPRTSDPVPADQSPKAKARTAESQLRDGKDRAGQESSWISKTYRGKNTKKPDYTSPDLNCSAGVISARRVHPDSSKKQFGLRNHSSCMGQVIREDRAERAAMTERIHREKHDTQFQALCAYTARSKQATNELGSSIKNGKGVHVSSAVADLIESQAACFF